MKKLTQKIMCPTLIVEIRNGVSCRADLLLGAPELKKYIDKHPKLNVFMVFVSQI